MAYKASVLYRRLVADAASGMLRLQPDSDDLEHELGAVLDACFSQTPPLFVRTNDALQLAAARVAREADFVTAGLWQRAAAQLLGFQTPAVILARMAG